MMVTQLHARLCGGAQSVTLTPIPWCTVHDMPADEPGSPWCGEGSHSECIVREDVVYRMRQA